MSRELFKNLVCEIRDNYLQAELCYRILLPAHKYKEYLALNTNTATTIVPTCVVDWIDYGKILRKS